MCPPLSVVIGHHVATNSPVILEGDGIHPGLVRLQEYGGVAANGQVGAVFLIEDDEDALLEATLARGRGDDQFTAAEQRREARAKVLYGRWLRREVRRLGVPVLKPRPWPTLADRLLAATGR